MTRRPLEELIYHMRTLARSQNAWEANFARSMLKLSKNPDWVPTPKQDACMRRLVAELFLPAELEVFE